MVFARVEAQNEVMIAATISIFLIIKIIGTSLRRIVSMALSDGDG